MSSLREVRTVVRRWLGGAVFLAVAAAALWAISRFAPRSPALIVAVCVLAVLTMKLVEHRVREWFDRWEAASTRRPRR